MNEYDVHTTVHERLEQRAERTFLWLTMLTIEAARRLYHKERKLSDQLGFDVVDIGGEG